jgi:hypothetical protein
MTTLVVRYRWSVDRADENQQLVEAVFAELSTTDPGGIRYATLRLADDTFVHIAEVGDDNPLARVEAFAAFQRQLGERVVEGPNPQPAVVVGSYGFDFGG